MRLILFVILAFFLTGCGTTTVVDNCPSWLEVGTIDIKKDTGETKRWMFRYEKNRKEHCEDK